MPTRDPLTRRRLGTDGPEVTGLCVGTSPLGSMPRLYGYDVGEEQAVAAVRAALDGPLNFLDTSNSYGVDGSSERRIGEAIRRAGGLPADFVLATKVDPDPVTRDFSGARVRRSAEESLERLGVDHVDLLSLHDPERITFAEAMATGGPVEVLQRLKEEGVTAHLGVAGGPVDVLQQYLDTGLFSFVLTHNRYTLLDQSARDLFHAAHERGIGTLNAAPYGGGMLVKGPDSQPAYAYRERDPVVADRARRMQDACRRHGVPLAAAALQFAMRAPSVDSVVVGISAPERVRSTLELAAIQIADELWEELADLTPSPERWLDAP